MVIEIPFPYRPLAPRFYSHPLFPEYSRESSCLYAWKANRWNRRNPKVKAKYILENLNKDGVDRRGFLKCMAWAGTGMIYALKSGILTSMPIGSAGVEAAQMSKMKGVDFSFIQISDSHIGFNIENNTDAT